MVLSEGGELLFGRSFPKTYKGVYADSFIGWSAYRGLQPDTDGKEAEIAWESVWIVLRVACWCRKKGQHGGRYYETDTVQCDGATVDERFGRYGVILHPLANQVVESIT